MENKLPKHVGRIYSLLDSHLGTEELENEREILDVIKEELNQADPMTSYSMMKVLKVLLIDILICVIGSSPNVECNLTKSSIQSNNERMKNSKPGQPSQAVLEEQRYQVLQGLLGRQSCQRE